MDSNWSAARTKSRFEERADERRRMKRQLTVRRRRSKNKGWGHPLEPFDSTSRRRLGRTGGNNHSHWRSKCDECLEVFQPGEERARGRFGKKVHVRCRDKPVMQAA